MSYQEYFGEIQQMIRTTAEKFVANEISPYLDEWEEDGWFPLELHKKAGELGLLGIGYPEELGGTGGDIFQRVVWIEELMRAGSSGLVAGLGSMDISLPPIIKFGTDELKQRIAPAVISGDKISALAITEPNGGSDVANLKTTAVREGNYYRVNGAKTFITSGTRADYFTTAVRTGGEGHNGISLLVIERNTPGFSVGNKLKKMGWWCTDTAELFFDDCMVPVENLIGEENKGFRYTAHNFESERLTLAVMANMTSELALNACLAYVKERKAFGKPLSNHQTIQHKLADMATLLEASKTFTYRGAAKMDAGIPAFKEICMAKNFSTDTSDKITYDAVQIFGGMGFMRETLVERLYRDNRVLSIGGGTREIMNEIIVKQIGVLND